MVYLILGILAIIIIGWFIVKSKAKSIKTKSYEITSKSDQIIKVLGREENDDGLSVEITVDAIYGLRCQFYKNGSPRVGVYNIEHGENYSYNVEASRWKDGYNPVIPDYQRKLTNFIKEEWTKAWENYGKPLYDKDRKKLESSPTQVSFSKVLLTLEYNTEELSLLPNEYVAKGSSGSTYKMVLSNLECSCPDFIERRSHYPINDIRRICKHQARAIIGLKQNTKLLQNTLIHAFVKQAVVEEKGIRHFKRLYEVKIDQEIKGPNPFYVLIPENESPWVEVLFLTDKSYKGYTNCGYHFNEKRWARHTNPFPTGSRQKYNWVMAKIADED